MQTTKRVPSKAVNHGREVEATTHTCRTPRRSLFSFQPTQQKTRNFRFPPSPRRFVPSCLRATCTPRFLRCCRQTSRQKTTLKKRKRTATVVTWFSLVSLPSSHPMHFPWLSHSIHRHATCENIHPPTRPFWHRFPSLSNSTPPQYPEKQHTATAQKLRCSLAAAKHKKHETCTIHTSGPPPPFGCECTHVFHPSIIYYIQIRLPRTACRPNDLVSRGGSGRLRVYCCCDRIDRGRSKIFELPCRVSLDVGRLRNVVGEQGGVPEVRGVLLVFAPHAPAVDHLGVAETN